MVATASIGVSSTLSTKFFVALIILSTLVSVDLFRKNDNIVNEMCDLCERTYVCMRIDIGRRRRRCRRLCCYCRNRPPKQNTTRMIEL